MSTEYRTLKNCSTQGIQFIILKKNVDVLNMTILKLSFNKFSLAQG